LSFAGFLLQKSVFFVNLIKGLPDYTPQKINSMKKLFLLCATFLWISATAQNNIPVNDTLRYFFYKQLYKLAPTTSTTAHPYFKSVAPVTGAGPFTHVGSVFKNKDAALKIYGLEAKVLSPPIVVSGPGVGGVKFRLYLCNVVNGLPVLPAIDSISAAVSATQPIQYGVNAGGTFTAGPRTVSGDFAVLGRCVSQMNGDTVNFLRTAGHTATSTSAPAPAYKFGEGLGVVRNAGVFYKTTAYNHPAFGPGTDYEFCVAPMVSFTLQVSDIQSPTQEGACAYEVFTNTNTSSPEFTNPQFNFNEFFRKFRPFHPSAAITTSFTADSVLTWDLGDGSPIFYLSSGIDTIHLAYVGGNCNNFFTGFVDGRHKQSIYNINAPTILASHAFTNSCVWCGYPDGINESEWLANSKTYPNPTTGKTTISGLLGDNTISVYNMMGDLISKVTTKENSMLIDLASQPQGAYLIRISDSGNNSKRVKLIRE